MRAGDFRHRAACRSVDPEVFFPTAVQGVEFEAQVSIAKTVCAGCPVRAECLTWALTALSEGVAGGMTEHERRVEAARRRGARRRHRPRPQRPAGGTPAEVAAAGRAALAAGMSVREVTGEFLVSSRTAGRWARALTDAAGTTTSRTSTRGAGEGESASAATVALSRVFHNNGLAGHTSSGRTPRVDDDPGA